MNIIAGSTYRDTLRWATDKPTFKAITGVSSTAPCVVTCVGHGVPEGWQVSLMNIKGMSRLNAQNNPPSQDEMHKASVLTADTISLPYVNAVGMGTYESSGVLFYYTPVDITGYTARMSIRDSIGGTELLSLTTVNGGIIIDEANYTISRYISATDTAAITWDSAVYDLEMVSPTGDVTKIDSGTVTVTKEVTV